MPPGAAAIWQKLLEESHGSAERHRWRQRLASCLVSAGRHEEARRVYRTLVLTQPDDDTARLGLAAVCLATGQPAEALAAALEVLETKHGNVDARLIAALSYQRLNQTVRAKELLSGIRSDDDPDGLVRELLARW